MLQPWVVVCEGGIWDTGIGRVHKAHRTEKRKEKKVKKTRLTLV